MDTRRKPYDSTGHTDSAVNAIHPPDLDLIPHLFTTCAECNLHKFHVLTKLPDALKAVVNSIDSVSGDVPCSLKKNIKQSAR